MTAKFHNVKETISQPSSCDFAAILLWFRSPWNWPSAWCDQLPMALTPFQLQIMHRLKHWIVDFLRFETKYSMHKLNFRKYSKSGWNDCHQECFMVDFSLLPLLAFRISLWQRTSKLRFFMFLSFPFALPWIPKNSPQSYIALVIKKLSKHQNLTQID